MDAQAWDERYRAAPSLWGAAPNRFVAERLTGRPPGRALDLACGRGRNALWLAGLGWRATAVDFSEAALAAGRAEAGSAGLDVDWRRADVTDYVPEPEAYDAVVIAYLQLPADRLAPVLRRAAAALAPGGRIVVVGHDRANPAEGVGGPQDPAVLYDHASITANLPGLSVLEAGPVTREVDGADRPAIDTLVVAERVNR